MDSIAKQAENIHELGFDANTTGYENNRTTILAGDINAAAELAPGFLTDVIPAFGNLFDSRRQALERHLGGIETYLLAQDARVSYELRDYIGWGFNPACHFGPYMIDSQKLGSFVLSGAGAGVFTDGVAVDKAKYGKYWLEVEVIGQTTSAEIVATIAGTKYDGTAQSKQVTIPISQPIGTKVNVGTPGTAADNFADVTGVTVTGGGASDGFEINGLLERTIAL